MDQTETTKPKRGILRVQDLYARSERRPGSSCWWWLGATSHDGNRCDGPRIWTIDHRRAEKRVMSGPAAVYNIAFKSAPPDGHKAYMRCMNVMCVNPQCVTTGTMRQLCEAMAASGKLKGCVPIEKKKASMAKARQVRGIKDTPADLVLQVLSAPEGEATKDVAQRLGLSAFVASRIRRGLTRRDVCAGAAMGASK